MKTLSRCAVVALAALTMGCMGTLPPMVMNPQAPALKVAEKRPLKVAVIVPEPMPYTILYYGQVCKSSVLAWRCYKRDMTAEMRSGGFPLESTLARVASDTFSQAFSQVVVLRDLPPPGQYDGVVTLGIGKILNQENVKLTGEASDITAEWTMSVLDKQNREILNKSGVSPLHNYEWSAFSPRVTFVKGVLDSMNLMLPEMAKDWGETLAQLDFAKKKS